MCKIITVPLVAIFILLSSFSVTVIAANPEDQIRELIQIKMMTIPGDSADSCGQDSLCKPHMVSQFYTARDFRPAWISNHARLPQIESLIKVIREADQDGLRPQDYHLDKLEKAVADWSRPNNITYTDFDRLADLDLLLTDAFFHLGFHLYSGRVDYRGFSPAWGAARKEANLVYILENALEYADVGIVLRGLVPCHQTYADLKEALRRNREIAAAGGWPNIPAGTTFNNGKEGISVIMLYERLLASDDLKPQENAVSYIFDHSLEEAVCKFQRRHGLKDDGKVGPETLKFLNMPVEEVMRRIELNMDRLRWLPDDLGERYVLVNIAGYSLEFIDHEQPVLNMRIIVGADEKRSYIFSDRIAYLELNPYWNIPESIAEKETLPRVKKNPQYLNEKKIKVIKGWSEPPVVIPSDQINWSSINR